MKAINPKISLKQLRGIVEYDPVTGNFFWCKRTPKKGDDPAKVASWNTRYSGKIAGSVFKSGYRIIDIEGKKTRAHRLAIKFITGRWPHADVDHVNGNRDDNRAANLRQATRSNNLQNATKLRSNNTSGVKGVSIRKDTGKWTVRLREFKGKTDCGKYKGKYLCFGSFTRKKDAIEAVRQARNLVHGKFAKHVTR